jgi:hypothetical protein
MVRLDVRGQVISLRREDAERLRAAAAGAGSVSSRRRDLALVLDWALASPRVVALRRSEAREFAALLAEDHALAHLGDALGGIGPAARGLSAYRLDRCGAYDPGLEWQGPGGPTGLQNR